MKITVKEHVVTTKVLELEQVQVTYADILKLTGATGTPTITLLVQNGPFKREGTLHPADDPMTVSANTTFTLVYG